MKRETNLVDFFNLVIVLFGIFVIGMFIGQMLCISQHDGSSDENKCTIDDALDIYIDQWKAGDISTERMVEIIQRVKG